MRSGELGAVRYVLAFHHTDILLVIIRMFRDAQSNEYTGKCSSDLTGVSLRAPRMVPVNSMVQQRPV